MKRLFLFAPAVFASFVLFAADASAQERTVALNFSAGGSSQIGITWQSSQSFALRPGVSINRDETVVGNNTFTTTAITADLDLLFTGMQTGRVRGYWGIGGSVGSIKSGPEDNEESETVYAGRGLFGLRVDIVERLAIFGEVGVEYRDLGEDSSVSTQTMPIGVMIFLR